MESDFEVVEAYLRDQRCLDEKGPTRSALARIEAKHNAEWKAHAELEALVRSIADKASGPGLSLEQAKGRVLGDVERLRADSERLRKVNAHDVAKEAWGRVKPMTGHPLQPWDSGPQVFRDHRIEFVRAVLSVLRGDAP